MNITQEKGYKPVTITLNTQQEYDALIEIVKEADDNSIKLRMSSDAEHLMAELLLFNAKMK